MPRTGSCPSVLPVLQGESWELGWEDRRAWAAGEVDVQGVAHFDSDAEKDRLDIKLRS